MIRYSIENKAETLITMSISDIQLERLKERCNITQAGWGYTGCRLNEDDLCDMIQNVEILLAGYENITSRVIHAAKKLKIIGISRSNPVNVDLSVANTRGIPVLFTPGRNSTAAAEFTMGLILDQARHISHGDRALRSGKYLGESNCNLFQNNPSTDVTWNLDGDTPYTVFRGVELHGRTLGLIGFGNVANKVADIAHAFGMQIISYAPNYSHERADHLKIRMVSLDTLLSESDFISVHCKATSETKDMLDERAFSLMKPSVYIINTARASIINQQALIQALLNGKIAGAALDVFWCEPLPSNHPLLKMENVTLSPHLAGSTREVPERHSKILVDDIIDWLDGKKPKYVFNSGIYSKNR